MTTNVIIETYIDSHVKDEATAVLATMELTISDAIRLMLIKVADEHKLPFDPFIPNAETVEAMEEARFGGLQSTETIEQFVDAMKLYMRNIEWTTAFKRDFKKIGFLPLMMSGIFGKNSNSTHLKNTRAPCKTKKK